MLKRLISSLVALPILLFVVLMGGNYIKFAAMLLSLIGLYEFYHAFRLAGYKPSAKLGYTYTFVLYGAGFLDVGPIFYIAIVFMFLYNVLIYNVLSKHEAILDMALTFLGFFYVAFSFFHISLISSVDSNFYIWYIFILAWGSDTFAYFAGRLFGRHKLIEHVSPKKTIEGSIGGLVGATLLSVGFAYMFKPEFMTFAIFLGLIGSILAQSGDLIASKIKRYCGIKDYGKIMPGHGGVLDRFDSIILTGPFIYYFIFFYMKWAHLL
ncbi:phosphatidate cytidylyltransferase [Fusibacter sp. JL216-2]|uniref:phosphatidate cytidylyltransferase n=1 Tax=Fusibacter sp. JL216-2 TaxID=3071453 RepID=UPI003D32A1B4